MVGSDIERLRGFGC